MKVTIQPVTLITIVAMDFFKSAKAVNRFEYVDQTGSTNTDLVAAATTNPSDYPHLSVLVAGSQTAGRGRTGRAWVSPAGKSLSISVLVRPKGWNTDNFGWLPLVAGVAMRRAVQSALPESVVALKWPNDVQVNGLKISGILSELLPGAIGVVIGAGVNLTLEKEELPIEAATSLMLEGSNISADDFLVGYLEALAELIQDFDKVPSTVRSECSTIGQTVRAIFPDGSEQIGLATGIDDSGRLLIAVPGDNQLLAVSAADIQHLRHN
jgi:BirA family biotin operon repressor/biotin-[acetyl-CoA-carboxylase] ligase